MTAPSLPQTSPDRRQPHPEPDVTWGNGGIDDWGWATGEQNDNDASAAVTADDQVESHQ